MNQARRWWIVLGAATAMVIGVAGWTARHPATASATASPPPVYGTVPPFALTDQQGRPVTRETLAGRLWVAEFIFTRCSGQCPMMVMQMRQLHNRLPQTAPVQLVSFTVDPGYDTPERLARYAADQRLPQERWWLLTGSQREIFRLAQQGFHLSASAEGGTAAEPVTHSRRLVLVDAQARIRGYYDVGDGPTVERLLWDIHTLLREPLS